MRHLVTGVIFHFLVGDEAVLGREVVELRAGVGVRDGYLDGFAVEGLGEVDGVADRLPGFAWKAENKVGVDDEAEVVAVLDEVAGALDGGTLLDVLEDLRIAGFEADDEETATGILHRLERVAVGGDARGARPGDAEGLELAAELDGADLLDVERVVVEEELLDVGEVFLGPCHFGSDVICGTLAPGVAGERLWPEAEGALRRAAARGVQRDVGVEQEWDVVAGHVHVALVDLGRPRHGVEVFNLGAVGIVLDDAGLVLVADAEDVGQWGAVRELYDGEVELAAANEIDRWALVEGAVGVGGDRGANEADLHGGVGALDGLGQSVVSMPADGRGKEHEELKVFGNLDGLVGGDVVRRSVQKLRAFQHPGGIGEPDRVPVRLDFADCGPAGAGTTVEVFKGGRVQEQRLEGWHSVSKFTIRLALMHQNQCR